MPKWNEFPLKFLKIAVEKSKSFQIIGLFYMMSIFFFFPESLYNLLLILSVMKFHNAVSQCGFFSSIILRLSGLL